MFSTTLGRIAGVAAVLAAAILWGTTGTVQALLPAEREPLVVAALRLLIGAGALFVLALAARPSRAAFRRVPIPWVLGAGVAIGLYNILFFVAVVRTGVGIGTALAIGSAPIWVTLFEFVLQRRVPSGRQAFGQTVCIAGAVLLALSGAATDASLPGMLIATVAGSAYATYSLLTSRIGHLAPSATIAASTFGVAAVCTAPLLLLLPTGWLMGGASWPKIIFLGVVATGVSYALYTWGLQQVAPATAVTLALAEPLTAWLLATVVVDEPVTLSKSIGAALLLSGLFIVTAAGARAHPGSHRARSAPAERLSRRW
jgi:drug/metabolite transporter, DME family